MGSILRNALCVCTGAIAVCVVQSSEASAFNLLTNGGFEDPDVSVWNLSGNVGRGVGANLASEGSAYVAFSGGNVVPNGRLFQSFSTTPGTSYSLRFDFGKFAVPGFGAGTGSLSVNVEGLGSLLSTSVSDNTGEENGAELYSSYNFDFTADNAMTTLYFEDTSSNNGFNFDIYLDNVAVEANAEPIPTPALLPGLIGMGAAALRKRKKEAEA
jgi:hypothetical protein